MALIKCSECGKQISDKSDKCVHCGCPIPKTYETNTSNNSQVESKNNFCIAGMIIGIISWFIDLFGLVSGLGLTLSIIGYSNANNSKEKNYATIGFIVSAIELLLKFFQLMGLISF